MLDFFRSLWIRAVFKGARGFSSRTYELLLYPKNDNTNLERINLFQATFFRRWAIYFSCALPRLAEVPSRFSSDAGLYPGSCQKHCQQMECRSPCLMSVLLLSVFSSACARFKISCSFQRPILLFACERCEILYAHYRVILLFARAKCENSCLLNILKKIFCVHSS